MDVAAARGLLKMLAFIPGVSRTHGHSRRDEIKQAIKVLKAAGQIDDVIRELRARPASSADASDR
jgi:hypothetical protein